jgi:hypothetical protein
MDHGMVVHAIGLPDMDLLEPPNSTSRLELLTPGITLQRYARWRERGCELIGLREGEMYLLGVLLEDMLQSSH